MAAGLPPANSAPLSGPVDASTFRTIAKAMSPAVVNIRTESRQKQTQTTQFFGGVPGIFQKPAAGQKRHAVALRDFAGAMFGAKGTKLIGPRPDKSDPLRRQVDAQRAQAGVGGFRAGRVENLARLGDLQRVADGSPERLAHIR